MNVISRFLTFACAGFVSATSSLLAAAAPAPAAATLLSVEKIWDAAPHNAFTDLVRFKGRWFCVFREGQSHVSPDGKLRVITSRNGRRWTSAALLDSPDGDLRDAKITITPGHDLMLSGAVAFRQPSEFKHQSLAWFSRDGRHWSSPVKIGEPNFWLWRVVWHLGIAYSVGYHTVEAAFVRLYRSPDGRDFKTLVPTLFDQAEPNESALVFLPDQTCLCVLRRDGQPGSGVLGEARPPYVDWHWRDLGVSLGGPQMIRLPDGRIVVGARHSAGSPAHTSLLWLDPATAKLTEFLRLPSGGDCSYPGLVWYRGRLWISYYSSHEGKTSVYLATVRLPRRVITPAAQRSGRRS